MLDTIVVRKILYDFSSWSSLDDWSERFVVKVSVACWNNLRGAKQWSSVDQLVSYTCHCGGYATTEKDMYRLLRTDADKLLLEIDVMFRFIL